MISFKGLVYNSYGNLSDSQLTYTSLAYANGPGGLKDIRTKNLTDEEVCESSRYQLFLFFIGFSIFLFLLSISQYGVCSRICRLHEIRDTRW